MNILIEGEIGVGKSTLINKLIKNLKQPIFGFRTQKVEMHDMDKSLVYIHPAAGEKIFSNDNCVGICSHKNVKVNPNVFDTIGVQLLSHIPQNSAVLMDELGFMESNSPLFCKAVFEILNNPYFVIAAVKSRSTCFLDAVRDCENVLLYRITCDNRDNLYSEILADLKRLNGSSPFLAEF